MRCGVFTVVLFLASSIADARGAAINNVSDLYGPLRVDTPFSSDPAFTHLEQVYGALADEVKPMFRRIEYIEYTVAKMEGCPYPSVCDPKLANKPHRRFDRSIGFDLGGMYEAFVSTLKDHEENACSDRTFSNPRRVAATDLSLIHI